MKNSPFKTGLIFFGVLIMAAGTTIAQDWTGWRGTDRDGKVSGFNVPSTWPEQLTKQWQVNVGLGDATPALAGNRLYVHAKQGTADVLQCLDAATGKEIWRDSSPSPEITGPPAGHNGPRSTPTVAEGKVLTLGPDGILSCLDASTGKVYWKNTSYTNEFPAFYIGISPLVYDGNCYVHFGGKETGSIISFDVKTGMENWKWTGDAPTYSSPVVMKVGNEKLLVVQTSINLVGLSLKDGKKQFKYPTIPERRFYNVSTPIVDGQTVYLTGQGTGAKALKIEKQADTCIVKEIWANKELNTSFNTAVLKDGYLYGNDANMGYLFCLNAATGEKCWKDTTKLDRFASVVDAGKIMVSLPASSSIIFFRPNPKVFEPVKHYKVTDTPAYAHPVISANRLFVKEKEMLTLWTID